MLWPILLCFLFFWLVMLFYQCRSSEKYNGYVDMKNYTFCSNLIVAFPKWLIGLLFLNVRLVKLPVTIVIGQIANYGLLLFFCIRRYTYPDQPDFYIPMLKLWGIVFMVLVIVMCVDHEIYCVRHKNKIHKG